MARLTRKNIKVFAENATNNGVFGSLQANNPTTTSDVEQIQSLSAWGDGWNSATQTSEKLPPLEEFQGIQYVTTYEQAYIMQEGLPEWASSVTYYKGSLVKKVTSTGFQIYNSLTDNNIGNALTDTANWKLVMDSDNLYALDSDVVHIAGAETITGTKTFTQNVIIDGINVASGVDSIKDYAVYDTNGNPSTSVRTRHYTDNSRGIGLHMRHADGSASETLEIRERANGIVYTQCPSSAQSSVNNWPLNSIVTLLSRNANGTDGYIKLGPVILQWGRAKPAGRTWVNVNLTSANNHISFSNANYLVFLTDDGSEGRAATTFKVSTENKTASRFRIFADSSAVEDSCSWFAIGF